MIIFACCLKFSFLKRGGEFFKDPAPLLKPTNAPFSTREAFLGLWGKRLDPAAMKIRHFSKKGSSQDI